MSHKFRAESFITPATALDNTEKDGRGNASISMKVENSLNGYDVGGGATDIDEVLSLSACRLNGDRVFVIFVIEDDVAGG